MKNKLGLYEIAVLFLVIFNITIYINSRLYTKLIKEIGCDTINKEFNFEKHLPTPEQAKLIKVVKNEMINDIIISAKLSENEKTKIINTITTIPIYVENMKNISKEFSNYEGVYIHNHCIKGENSRYILLESDIFNRNYRYVILHELRHLVDNILINGDSTYNTWSDKFLIKKVLDQKLLDDNYYSYYMLREKVRGVSKYSSLANVYKDSLPELNDRYKQLVEDEIMHILLRSKKYVTSNSELYVRIYIMKKWLIDNGAMKDINEPINEEHIKFILTKNPIDLGTKNDIQFFEIFFFFNIDMDFDKKEYTINNINDLNNIKF